MALVAGAGRSCCICTYTLCTYTGTGRHTAHSLTLRLTAHRRKTSAGQRSQRRIRDVVNMAPDLDRGATPLVSDAHSTLFHSTFTTAACLTLESALRAVAFHQLRYRGLCAQ